MTRPFILLSALVAASAAVAPGLLAQEARTVTLEEALRLFAANNIELRIARARAAEAAGLAVQAAAFQNPAVTATHEPLTGDAGSYSESYLNLSQRFELPGERGARVEAADRRRDAALAALRADSVRLVFGAKRAFVEAWRASERLSVTERVAATFREAARSAEERYGAGDLSLYEARRIGVERARYETLLGDAAIDLGQSERALALLVAPDADAPRLSAALPATAGPPAMAADVLESLSVQGRAELAAARAEVEAAEAAARLARAERVPDITATAGFKRQSDDRRGAFLGLSVPLPVFDRNGGAVQAADAGVRAARERLALVRRQLENDVRRAADAYETLLRRAQLLGPGVVAEAADLLEIARVAYDAGEMDLVELLDAAEALHEARTAEARLRADLWIAYFDLERALGGFDAAPAPTREDGR